MLLPCRPGFVREHERHPRGLAGARRRDQHRGVARAQSRRSAPAAPHRSEAAVQCSLIWITRPTSPCRTEARVEDKCIARLGRWRNHRSSVKSEACQPKPKNAPTAPKLPHPPSRRRPLKKGDHVFLVDGSGYIFRAYHALPPLTRKSDGLQVNAVLGFCNMLWKLLRDMKPEERPTHLAVVFDKSEKTFRNEIYPDYKAHRPEPPDDLIPQFPLHPRGGARLRHALPGAGRLRGRRPDRDLCAARLRGGRDRDHRVLRQGPDAARERLRHHVRHDEGQADRHPPR